MAHQHNIEFWKGSSIRK